MMEPKGPIPNPFVTVTCRWINHWQGFMREDPDTLRVHWRLVNTQLGYSEGGYADDGPTAWLQMDQAHTEAITKGVSNEDTTG